MSFSPHKIRVGVLRGGPSAEYDVSLNTGKTILANMPEQFEPIDVFISKEGDWHTTGLQKNPYDILKMLDIAFNATHGAYGEDGNLQRFLENFGIPYTGSNSIASALGMNKIMSKEVFNRHGLKTPHHITISSPSLGEVSNIKETILEINESLPFPIVIKPISSGSSLGISVVEKNNDLEKALKKSFEHSPYLLVEEYINGKEATCGVIEGFRNQNMYTLLPVEIKQIKKEIFYDYDSKYKNLESRCKIPGDFNEEEKRQIQEATILAHEALGLRHYSRADFILHPKRGLFILEVNTLPELTHRSSFIKSLEAVGGNIREFLSHLITKALGRKF